jgi:hypothetical protein
MGMFPRAPQACDLQLFLAKATSSVLVLQPPFMDTAVHVINTLAAAERAAAAAADPSTGLFVTFPDSFLMYANLLSHRTSGAYSRAF